MSLNYASSMKFSIRPFEHAFSVVSLLLFSQGFYAIILGGSIGGDEGDIDSAFLRIAFLLIYAISFALLAFRSQRTLYFLKSNVWITLLVLMAVMSISWSTLPDVTFRKAISLIGTTFFAVYLASRYTFKEQLKIYGWSFGIAVVCSLLFGIALPQYGISTFEAVGESWRGIYPHKNGLGQNMFISFLTFYFLSVISSDKKQKLLFQAFYGLSIILTILAQSGTSLMGIIFIFTTAQVLNSLSLTSKKGVLTILLAVIAASLILFVFFVNFEALLNANDKDITLTGRTPLWATLWEFMRARPWLGFGYGSFFDGLSREGNLVWKVHTWVPIHAHNGYIHLWLQLGVIGLGTLIFGYVKCLFTSLSRYLTSKNLRMLWVFLFLLYTVTLNITEVSFLSSQGIVWIISLVAIYSMKEKDANEYIGS
ncbi:MAG: O-antigen ligase family protein [Cyanobacteria bacterium J06600_6]